MARTPARTAAPIEFNSDRAAFGGDDFVNWKQLGREGSVVDVELGSNGAASSGGLGCKVVFPTRCQRVDQGRNKMWPGNFKTSDALLYSWKRVGPIAIVFDDVVRGVGAQIQEQFGISKPGGAPFTGILRAFDENHNPIVQNTPRFSERHGWSDDGGSDPAIFMGLLYATAKIKSVEFDTRALDLGDLDGDFAINGLSLVR